MRKIIILLPVLLLLIIVIWLLVFQNAQSRSSPPISDGFLSMTIESGPDNIWRALLLGENGPNVVWGFNVINCSDYSATKVVLKLNTMDYPFFETDSIPPHTVLIVSRNMYNPKILMSDTVHFSGFIRNRKQINSFELSNGVSLKGKYGTQEESSFIPE